MRRVAFLTSGGDCQALNATMRGVAKTLYNADPDTEIIGILEGYKGLIFPAYLRRAARFSVLPGSPLKICASRMKTAWIKCLPWSILTIS